MSLTQEDIAKADKDNLARLTHKKKTYSNVGQNHYITLALRAFTF